MLIVHPSYYLPRLLIEAMVMTGSDLCASAKPWHLQLETVAVIYEEFYIQVGNSQQTIIKTLIKLMF